MQRAKDLRLCSVPPQPERSQSRTTKSREMREGPDPRDETHINQRAIKRKGRREAKLFGPAHAAHEDRLRSPHPGRLHPCSFQSFPVLQAARQSHFPE